MDLPTCRLSGVLFDQQTNCHLWCMIGLRRGTFKPNLDSIFQPQPAELHGTLLSPLLPKDPSFVRHCNPETVHKLIRMGLHGNRAKHLVSGAWLNSGDEPRKRRFNTAKIT
jgi:hypothetical protein